MEKPFDADVIEALEINENITDAFIKLIRQTIAPNTERRFKNHVQPMDLFLEENITFLADFLDKIFKCDIIDRYDCKRKHHIRRLFRHLEEQKKRGLSKRAYFKLLLIYAEFFIRNANGDATARPDVTEMGVTIYLST